MSVNILVVDDAPFIRRNLVKIFTEAGWKVVGEAGNGREAVERYLAVRPDIVTMDITMPDMDGIAAVKAIVQLDPKARIVMCSALGQMDMVMDAIRSGAKDFIVKPFQKDRVLEGIQSVLAKSA